MKYRDMPLLGGSSRGQGKEEKSSGGWWRKGEGTRTLRSQGKPEAAEGNQRRRATNQFNHLDAELVSSTGASEFVHLLQRKLVL